MSAQRTRIVLLPGMDGTGDLFESFVATSPPDIEPFVIPLPPLATYEQLATSVQESLPDGQFVLLGESFSGPLALRLAAAEPSRIPAVILCNSFVAPPRTPLLRFVPWRLLLAMRPPVAIRHYFLGASASATAVAAVRNSIAKTPARVLVGRMFAVFALRTRDVPPIAQPLLDLRGTEDKLVRRMSMAAVQQVAPHTIVKEIGGPHLLLQTNPREAWNAIADFLATSKPASTTRSR